eukprot:scaffold7375_cov268-Pinguiococcus_pyrenoidosus.AAC.4
MAKEVCEEFVDQVAASDRRYNHHVGQAARRGQLPLRAGRQRRGREHDDDGMLMAPGRNVQGAEAVKRIDHPERRIEAVAGARHGPVDAAQVGDVRGVSVGVGLNRLRGDEEGANGSPEPLVHGDGDGVHVLPEHELGGLVLPRADVVEASVQRRIEVDVDPCLWHLLVDDLLDPPRVVDGAVEGRAQRQHADEVAIVHALGNSNGDGHLRLVHRPVLSHWHATAGQTHLRPHGLGHGVVCGIGVQHQRGGRSVGVDAEVIAGQLHPQQVRLGASRRHVAPHAFQHRIGGLRQESAGQFHHQVFLLRQRVVLPVAVLVVKRVQAVVQHCELLHDHGAHFQQLRGVFGVHRVADHALFAPLLRVAFNRVAQDGQIHPQAILAVLRLVRGLSHGLPKGGSLQAALKRRQWRRGEKERRRNPEKDAADSDDRIARHKRLKALSRKTTHGSVGAST